MSGGVRKCKRCNTYKPADEMCQCSGVPKNSKLVEDFIIPEMPVLIAPEKITTLPTDSDERKGYPLYRGCFQYFPAALAGVARISKLGNDKHNPGEDMHHARSKSTDHGDCVLRHLMDLSDLLALVHRDKAPSPENVDLILTEASSLAWRALALSQELHELFGAPMAPGAKD